MIKAKKIFKAIGFGLLVCAVMLTQGRPVQAAPNVYEIRGVSIDVTAKTAAAAREEALANGEMIAFRLLLERLTLQADREKLPFLSREEIAVYIQDFSVSNEKTSSVRYLAELNFRFKKKEVRQLLTDYGVPFAETASKAVLVLPVYQAEGSLSLWDDSNPWRTAWGTQVRTDGLVPKMLPVGDLGDIGLISANQAIEGDRQRLVAIAERYKVSDAIVAAAALDVDPATGGKNLIIKVQRNGLDLESAVETLNLALNPGETVEALLVRGIHGVEQIIDDQWKYENLLTFDQLGIATVVVPIEGLSHWLRLLAKLKDIAVIRRTEMVLLTKEEIRINLHHIGDRNQLILALHQADLDLVQEADEWILGFADDFVAGKT